MSKGPPCPYDLPALDFTKPHLLEGVAGRPKFKRIVGERD